MGTFGFPEKALAGAQAAFFHRAIQVQQGLAQFIDLGQVGQVRALAERGQLIEQGVQFLSLIGMLLPTCQQRFGIEQDVHALGKKAGNQLRVALEAQATGGGVQNRFDARAYRPLDALYQHRRALYGLQRIAGQVLQPLAEQGFGRLQQRNIAAFQGNQVGLVFARQ
ncbi:hypothetical protein D3C80_1148720 [compost metagenome]